MESPYGSESYLVQLLAKAVAAKASDIHLKVGHPPGARVRGEHRVLPHRAAAPGRHRRHRAHPRSTTRRSGPTRPRSSSTTARTTRPGVGRFRVNVYRQRGTLGDRDARDPAQIPTFEELGAPRRAQYLAERDRGLVLVVGAAGNGKSSTLAAMIGHLNHTQPLHIVTIEDPIEFLHDDDKSSISQREVGIDTGTFADALRAALRQDPDVILVGEIRDELTIDIALKAAETGHLVLSTLHTPDVARTVGRMLVARAEGQPGATDELRERIGDSLQGIVAQRLLPQNGRHGPRPRRRGARRNGHRARVDQAPGDEPADERADGEGDAPVRHADLRDALEAARPAGPDGQRRREGRSRFLTVTSS